MAESAALSASAGTACDIAGAVLLTASAAWAVFAASGRDVGPEGQLLALLAVTAGYAAGRIAGAVAPLGSLVACAAVVVLLPLVLPGGLSGDPAAPPLHQADADAALLALGAGAAGAALRTARSGLLRAALALVALGLVGESLATGSVAGFLACGGVLVVAAATGRTRQRGLVLVLLAAVVVVVGAAVFAAAVTRTAEPPVTGSHVAQWHQALDAVRAAPLRGSGFTSPEAAAPPSAALQVAAQQGLPGLALLAAAFAWTLWALALSPRPTPAVLAVGAAVAALGAEALLTPVLSVPGVTAAAGFLLGLAAARPLNPRQPS